ncbi:MAG: peptidyl-prolyl cis-trans isomerase, partial [Chthoniobacteraceae bacterium]
MRRLETGNLQPSTRKRWLGEPLLHFLLIGAVIFGAYTWRNRGEPIDAPLRQVRISEPDVQWLRQAWERQRQREPTREELRGLVTEFLNEELLSREAREMGLDQDDTIVRRRLAQKVEFLVQDTSGAVEPTENDLRKFHAAHPEWFSKEPRISFAQVYFNHEHEADVAQALALLETNADPRELGDRLPIDSEIHDADQQTVASQFGVEFGR